jgi:S1-C subfamily serine protease
MHRRVLFTSFFLVIAGPCLADPADMGKAFPEAAGPQARSEVASFDSVALDGLQGKIIKDVLFAPPAPDVLNTRGRKEIDLYRNVSPAIVLVVTKDGGLGSGSHIGSGQILTNWHVVQSFKTVGVVFKPGKEGAQPNADAIIRADVVFIDRTRDLALLRVANVPKSVPVVQLANLSEIEVGADVHAIGHPFGIAWTYTKGVISQVHRDYAWKAQGIGSEHRATVIQTQTPINPGNSGGPLIGDSGKMIGVNSFGAPTDKAQGLNYAVSVEEVLSFLKSATRDAMAAKEPSCKVAQLYDGRNRSNDGRLIQFDTNCDGKVDFTVVILDDTSKPITGLIDSNHDGKIDITVEDTNRDGKWDVSFHDVDHDGKIDVVGYHPDGKITPSRFEKYAQR